MTFIFHVMFKFCELEISKKLKDHKVVMEPQDIFDLAGSGSIGRLHTHNATNGFNRAIANKKRGIIVKGMTD